MADYTTVTIDGINLKVDPDAISVSIANIVSVDKSLGGTSYVTSIKSNTPGVDKSVTIAGALLPESRVSSLLASAGKKVEVSIGGGLAGLSGKYVITNMSIDPIKPLFKYDNSDTEVKYRYNISLREVD